MNPRQRRGLLLIAVAIVGAIGVFVSVANYVADVQAQVGPLGTVVRLTKEARSYQPVTDDMIEQVAVPERWRPRNALVSSLELEGRVPASTLPAGTVLQEGLLIDPPQLEDGERELAILVDAETGVAGKIGRGSIVDIFATFPGTDQELAHASIVVESAEILDVGTPTAAPTQESDGAGGFAEGEVVPVTFALSVDESLRLAYIESFATNVRLALRAPDDDAEPSQRLYQPDGVGTASPAESSAAADDLEEGEGT
jgi:pilus assembly protein CpaB